MSIKMCLYSITYLGVWYRGGALTWKEVLRRAKDFGFDGVEFDAKRPHANPMDWDERTRREIVEEAVRLGLALPALAANNDFSSPIAEHREAQLLMVKEQLKLARNLGCKCLRVFSAWRGVSMRDGIANYEEAKINYARFFAEMPAIYRWRFVRDALREACKYAEEYGVPLALQNHQPVTSTWEDVHRMIEEVGSPWLKACFDINGECDDPETIRRGFDTIGHIDMHSHFNGEWERTPGGKLVNKNYMGYPPLKHYHTFVNEMKRVGYDGYMAFEFCHPATIGSEFVDIAYVDEQTRYALEFMRGLIDG